MGNPQFETQDDTGIGDGIPPIPDWHLELPTHHDSLYELESNGINIDSPVVNVFSRLRNIFQRAQQTPLPATRLHDLTCFVIHRLLLQAANTVNFQESPLTECIRYTIILYMFIIQGPTYFSHAVIQNSMVTHLIQNLELLKSTPCMYDSLDIWFSAIGLMASTGTASYEWFVNRAQALTSSLLLSNWDDIIVHIKSVMWLESAQAENIFRPHWDAIFDTKTQLMPHDSTICFSPSTYGAVLG